MSRYQRVVRAFVASPGDTAEERSKLGAVITELNNTWSDFIGVRIDLVGWETHTWPMVASDPQQAINCQIADDYDIFIGILGGRIGSPTPRAESGTIEEFERAYARQKETPDTPAIMLYFRDGQVDAGVGSFRTRTRELGIYDWTYNDLRNFEQATRIHLSRQIQRIARSAASTASPFPSPDASDIDSALASAHVLLDSSAEASGKYMATTRVLIDLTHQLAENMRDTASKLNRLKRPGFRRRPGARESIVRAFAGRMLVFADETTRLTPLMTGAYHEMVGNVTRSLQIISPLFPLPFLLRAAVEESAPTVAEMQRAVTTLRSSADGARQVLAGWSKQDSEFNRSHRAVLTALDGLDEELTSSIHLTRELERTIHEFLDQPAT